MVKASLLYSYDYTVSVKLTPVEKDKKHMLSFQWNYFNAIYSFTLTAFMCSVHVSLTQLGVYHVTYRMTSLTVAT